MPSSISKVFYFICYLMLLSCRRKRHLINLLYQTFSNVHVAFAFFMISCFPLFCLETKKWSKKVQGKPERSARFALPTHSNTHLFSASFTCFISFGVFSYNSKLFQNLISTYTNGWPAAPRFTYSPQVKLSAPSRCACARSMA